PPGAPTPFCGYTSTQLVPSAKIFILFPFGIM
ncbi:MAG: hypothetical protein ACJA0G_001163, partial [Kangiellaceae bacterium]